MIGMPAGFANVRRLATEVTRHPFSDGIDSRPSPLPGGGLHGKCASPAH
jgi:hypothetical protein